MNLRYLLSKTIRKAKLLPIIGMFFVAGANAQEMRPNCHPCAPFPDCFKTGFFVEGDFLYWRPEVNEMEYAYSLNRITNEAIDQYDIRYDYEPGFQVALGYLFGNNWDLLARYTNLRANQTDMISSTFGPPELFAAFVHGNVSAIISATSHSKFYYDILDIEAIRHVFSGNRLELLAFVGVRGAWVTQNWKTDYSPLPGQLSVTFVQNKWKVRGGGLRFGFDGNLELGYGFTLFGTAALSGLLADQETKFLVTTLNQASIFNANLRFSRTKVFPVLESSVGISWGSYFREGIMSHRRDLWGIHIGARYEFIQWWNINDVERMNSASGFDDVTPGDLGLHGLTLRVTIVF